MKYVVILLILVGFTGIAYASHNDTLHSDVNTTEEHYEIEIMGLKEKYVIGEQYSFYFVISGNGDECARINVSYPDENGRLNGWGSEPLCDPNLRMYDFETKYFDQQEHFGNIAISNPGTYTVTITFDRPNKYFPTIATKEFRVVESIDEDSYKLTSPLKQFRTGITTDEIQCKDNLVLIQKHDGSPACVKPVTKQHLIDRNWGETKSLDEIEHNPKLIKQNVIRIEDGFISLYPENMCASITLDLPTEEDIQRYASDEKGLREGNVLQITDKDLKEIPIIQELIYAAHSIEFPYNKHSSAYLEGLTFVEYEFFLMEKAIEKYGDLQGDYFIQLDNDYEQRFTNPTKQGFTNHFESPVIVYNDAAYSVSGTNFWTSDEHEPRRMSIFPIDGIKGDEKFITLTDEDMKSIPEIKEAIESIGTIQESISAHKGLPEDRWNEYREWFEQKSQERLNADRFRLIQYDEQLYSMGFGIC